MAQDLDRVERTIVERTNEFRAEEGLGGLKSSAALQRAARHFADYMATTDRYGHEADGAEPADRAKRQGYDYCLVAENISYQYTSMEFTTAELARRYVEGWKKSPGHRKNMLAADAVDTGVAVSRSAKTRRFYAVQLFGRPRSAQIRFQVRNTLRETARYRVGDTQFTLPPELTRLHTQCGAEELSLIGGGGRDASVTPANGDRVVVVRDQTGGMVLRADR